MLPIILAGASLAMGAMSADASRDAGRLRVRAARVRNRQAALENERKIREFVRGAQQAQATQLARATAMGGGNTITSGAQGTASSIRTKAATELDYFVNMARLDQQAAMYGTRAMREENLANTYSALSSMFGQGASMFGAGG